MFTLVMGSNGGGFGLWFIGFGVGLFCAIISISCAASRATWAFARDKAIPLHGHFSKIGPPTSVTYLSTPLSSPRLSVISALVHLMLCDAGSNLDRPREEGTFEMRRFFRKGGERG